MMMTKLGIPEKVLFIVQQVGIRASVLLDSVQGNVTGNRGVAVNENRHLKQELTRGLKGSVRAYPANLLHREGIPRSITGVVKRQC
jgi:hypothetical protein